jgi:hypothetical protein
MQQAMADRDMLGVDLQGYERALSAEMRDQGITASPKSTIQEPLPLNGTGDVVSKAEFARQFIRGRAETGATPADLFKGFQDAKIPIKKPYIYALVQRLQGQTAIRLKRGKWYPVPESEQSQAPNGE